jgi:hypothetical protein
MNAIRNFLLLATVFVAVHNGAAQCYPDRHSTNFFDGWLSCAPAASPNPARPASHFILYDFNKVYALGRMKIWNTNDPARTGDGLREVAIDVSRDGQNWTHVGDYTLERAPGVSTYEGFDGPDLGGAEGRYLLITALSNHGGECYGLSEMRVEGEEVIISSADEPASFDCIAVNLYPNPFTDQVVLGLSPDCEGVLRYSLFDQQGKQLDGRAIGVAAGQSSTYALGAELPAGTYVLQLEFQGKVIRRTLVKMNRT